MTPPPPPTHAGQRLLPSALDEIAKSDPDRVLYSITKTDSPADGFRDITAKEFAQAVDRCAWYIEQQLGRGHGFPTVAYMGPQDIVYPILILACIKTGYKLLLNSTRNTLEAHLSLMEKTECHTFLLPPSFHLPVVKQVLSSRPMRRVDVPGALHWLDCRPVATYPYRQTYAEAKHEPFVVLHTSGTTGMPKPILLKHATISPTDAYQELPAMGYPISFPCSFAGTRSYIGFPLFHCAGIVLALVAPIYIGYTSVLGPFPPSADVVAAVHMHANVQRSVHAPMTFAELVKNPEHFESLSRLEGITFAGGPLPQPVGDLISTKTVISNGYGTTEAAGLPCQPADPEDWAYLSFSPAAGMVFRHVVDDLYESVIVRDPKLELYQGIFATFPELEEYPVKDLYQKHPTKENLWLYKGRTDDIVVLVTGEKFNPVEMEDMISVNSSVRGALIAGLGRFQSCLLVEAAKPPKTDQEKEALLEAIWPSVQEANKEAPSHARLHRHMVTFTSHDKPMFRAGKGTVQRRLTLDSYAAELDELYEKSESVVDGDKAIRADSVQGAVRQVLAISTDIDIDKLSPEAKLFDFGLDSLHIVTITKYINAFLLSRGRQPSLEAQAVYSNATVTSLTSLVTALADGTTPPPTPEPLEQAAERLYTLHEAELPLSSPLNQPPPPSTSIPTVVLLTGSTGSLGCYILTALLSNPHVSKIYCLNRGPDSPKRQAATLAARGLPPLPADGKATCLDADLPAPNLGLPAAQHDTLAQTVTTIIHAAWLVDFNRPLSAFSPLLSGVCRLAAFAAASPHRATLLFLSSVASVANYPPETGTAPGGTPTRVPETLLPPATTPPPFAQTGYGASKHVAERLLDTAARRSGVRAAVCRVGQIAGPVTPGAGGCWPRHEWLPSLVASSAVRALGRLPRGLGRVEGVDWVPVDVLGRVVGEVALAEGLVQEGGGVVVYHAVNPVRTRWGELSGTVAGELGGVEVVELAEWVRLLRESATTTEDLTGNPAVKLLGFYEGLEKSEAPILLDTARTIAVSPTLAGLGPVTASWMEIWMRQWAF